MKIAIISDTHDNLATLDKFLAFVKKNPMDAIIHCGDIAEGETLEQLAKNYDGRILAAFDNMDYRDTVEAAAKKYPGQIKLFADFGQADPGGVKIGFCHFPETAKKLCQTGDFDFFFYGHTHKPWVENIGACRLANPGNLAGMFYKASFAVLDVETKKLELKIVERLR
jgi:uncharacterized protein